MSFDMSMNGMPGMRALPPIRTKSYDANGGGGSMMSGGGHSGGGRGHGESPMSDLPGSGGRLVTGLTPHAGMLMNTGLTPTGLTPGSLAGFPVRAFPTHHIPLTDCPYKTDIYFVTIRA